MHRNTPQTDLIRNILKAKLHATNKELAAEARKIYPNMTETTVHRITARLVESQQASYAPNLNQVMIFDANTKPHDHFYCQNCNSIFNIELSEEIFSHLWSQLTGKEIRNCILVAGLCENCTR